MSEEKSKMQYLASTPHISKMHYNRALNIVPIYLSFFEMSAQQSVPALSFDVLAWGCFMIHEIITFSFTMNKFQQPTEVLS